MTASIRASLFDHRGLCDLADWLAVGVAMSLPWSTTATGILIALWLLAVLPTMNAASIWRAVTTPAGGLPVLLWLFAAAGLVWADVAWTERLAGLGGFNRLLVIPVLLEQFRRSERGAWVLCGFLGSAICLLIASWLISIFFPLPGVYGKFHGVPVKDYIFQSDEFLLCGVALLGAPIEYWPKDKRRTVLLCALGIAFLANLAFVIVSRTDMFVAPVLILALGWRLSGLKGALAACVIAAVAVPVLWVSSPRLHDFALHSFVELHDYFATNAVTSAGMHVEFLRKSLDVFETAPIFGHGTGSIAEQLRLTTTGETGAGAIITVNPHDQIFAVAIQLGIVGAAILVAMWAAHFLLFRSGGMVAWAGIATVILNIATSLAHSHLFDFSHGWLYVFIVGAAGGVVLRQRDGEATGAATG
jgi:O-antigen ligase